jgi:putative sugar O-methyltransferase
MSWTLQEEASHPYLNSCRRAASDPRHFEVFKQDPAYRHVLEHVPFEEGQKYLDAIKIDYADKLEEIKENDKLGSPYTFDYPNVGNISPTTLRYIKNTSDIVNKFGTNFKSIVEIGGGYGGLCKVLSSFVDFESYLLIDLEEPNLLSRKYLSNFDLPTLSHRAEEIEVLESFDLLISNYAFSELDRETQLEHIDKFVRKSDRFYMMYNDFSPTNIHHLEFIDMLSDSYDIEFYPDHGIDTEPKVMYGVLK